jgi:hypothetical protein
VTLNPHDGDPRRAAYFRAVEEAPMAAKKAKKGGKGGEERDRAGLRSRATGDVDTEVVSIRLPSRLAEALRHLSKRTGISQQHLYRAAAHKLIHEKDEILKMWENQTAEFEAIEAQLTSD